MDCAPLNLAHFHERRADKLIKRHRYEEAFKAIETSLLYVEDAYMHVKIPEGLDVLNTQKWDYERKLNQIHMRKIQYDKMKTKEIVVIAQTEVASNNIKKENSQSIARSIDKTIKEFNDKYGNMSLENMQQIEMPAKEKVNSNNSIEQKGKTFNNSKEILADDVKTNIESLSLIDDHLQSTDDDLPSLAPLELPAFDYKIFGI